ncbi:MAG: Ig-like domain-containing protein [Lachnospiraceae bacterium]
MKKILAVTMALIMYMSVAMTIYAEENVSEDDTLYDGAEYGIPDDADSFNEHYYYVYDRDSEWTQAKNYCESIGGHLVTITSGEEQQFVVELIQKYGQRKNYWLGGHQNGSNNSSWYWVTGEAFSYTNWANSQPDHSNEDCLMMYTYDNPNASGNETYKWNDLVDAGTYGSESWFGTANFGYICEWDDYIIESGDGNTSTESLYEEDYQNFLSQSNGWDIFKEFSNCAYSSDLTYIIPGIRQTNMANGKVCTEMVPQGTCVAGEFLLISAYDSGKENNSVIYVMDKNTGKYKKTIVLKDMKAHVGALAYNEEEGMIYIADSNKGNVWCLPLSEVRSKVKTKNDAEFVELSQSFSVTATPSFLTYYRGKLFVGQYHQKKSTESQKKAQQKSYMEAYKVSGEYKSNPQKCMEMKLPLKSQGVQFIDFNGKTYLFCSCSGGRKNKSILYVYKINRTNEDAFSFVNINGKENVSVNMPNMSEDVERIGNNFYTCFESAAYKYQMDKNDRCPYPLDRITRTSLGTLMRLYILKNGRAVKTQAENSVQALNAEEEDIVISQGSCGEELQYVLYDDGALNITGQGAMDDYDYSSLAPWETDKDQIKAIYVGADVTNIGSYAFSGCSSLETIEISDFSAIDKVFSIGEGAFENCINLKTVKLPEKDYEISETAFAGIEGSGIEIQSDAKMVKDYCEEQGISLHTHDYQYVETVDMTCARNGYDLYQCAGCQKTECRNVVEITEDHVFEEESRIPATEESSGSITYKCKNCGMITTEELEPATPQKLEIKISKITISGLSKQIAAGKKIKLTASVFPANATNKAVTWKSSNTKVATVTQSGVVTMKKGSGGKSVTITAMSKDGSSVKATYKIKSMKGFVKKITISGSKSVKAGKSLKLKAKVTATKSANKKLKWTSSNTKYAKVSSSGKVTTYKAGKGKKVKITAMATDGSGKKKTVTIKIK